MSDQDQILKKVLFYFPLKKILLRVELRPIAMQKHLLCLFLTSNCLKLKILSSDYSHLRLLFLLLIATQSLFPWQHRPTILTWAKTTQRCLTRRQIWQGCWDSRVPGFSQFQEQLPNRHFQDRKVLHMDYVAKPNTGNLVSSSCSLKYRLLIVYAHCGLLLVPCLHFISSYTQLVYSKLVAVFWIKWFYYSFLVWF